MFDAKLVQKPGTSEIFKPQGYVTSKYDQHMGVVYCMKTSIMCVSIVHYAKVYGYSIYAAILN